MGLVAVGMVARRRVDPVRVGWFVSLGDRGDVRFSVLGAETALIGQSCTSLRSLRAGRRYHGAVKGPLL